MADLKISPASPQPDGPSYLNDLPPELLRRILEFTLPQGLTFTFFYTRKGRGTRILMAKEIPVFITGNEWSFSIPGLHGEDLEQPLFGPLEQPNHTGILRELQRVELQFGKPICSISCANRERDHLQHFVDAFNDCAEDPGHHSALHTLKVRIPEHITVLLGTDLGGMFTLEVLSGLKRQLKKVTVEGPPPWFAQCLVLHLTGRGGPPASKLSWPTKIKRRKITRVRKITRGPSKQKWIFKRVTTRKDWQPRLDWREYALRNEIELPDDIDRYFPPSQ